MNLPARFRLRIRIEAEPSKGGAFNEVYFHENQQTVRLSGLKQAAGRMGLSLELQIRHALLNGDDLLFRLLGFLLRH